MDGQVTRRGLLGGALTLATAAVTGKMAEAETHWPVLATAASLRIAQVSDFHWGYRGDWNRNLSSTVERILTAVRGLNPAPSLLLVTGDLIQATSDAKERQRRLETVKAKLEGLNIPWLAVPGEHDTFGDQGQLFQQVIGSLFFHRAFQGLHMIGLDNVSRGPFLGNKQYQWFRSELARLQPTDPVVVFSHRPLYDVFTPWNWYTYDGDKVYTSLDSFNRRLCVFGHVHQAMSHQSHHTANLSGLPASWPLPSPGPLERLQPWPQGASHPDMGLGFRVIDYALGSFTSRIYPLTSTHAEVELI